MKDSKLGELCVGDEVASGRQLKRGESSKFRVSQVTLLTIEPDGEWTISSRKQKCTVQCLDAWLLGRASGGGGFGWDAVVDKVQGEAAEPVGR